MNYQHSRAHMNANDIERVMAIFEVIIRGIVDNENDVMITARPGEQTLQILIQVNKADIGKVIGKKGTMAEALRKINSAISTKLKMRSVLEIVE
jgi:predicted RNA-binding protein YlqC (UPF0109 family)